MRNVVQSRVQGGHRENEHPTEDALQASNLTRYSVRHVRPYEVDGHDTPTPAPSSSAGRDRRTSAVSSALQIRSPAQTHTQTRAPYDTPIQPRRPAYNASSGPEFSRNPLVGEDSAYMKDPEGIYRFLAPSSTWSFCRRVLALLMQQSPGSDNPPDPFNYDGTAYRLRWKRISEDEDPDISNLPALDYALYFFNVVKFHLGQFSNIVDEESYLQNLDEFYVDTATKARSSRLWFAQYLLVLAFGKAFVGHASVGPSSSLPGVEYASRAMALLPDMSAVEGDGLFAIEVLCLASLYFQSIDMRIAAFQHIGQALRYCYVEGIHRHLPEGTVGSKLSQRCNTVWWTVYILDREFTALMGGPSTIPDEQITAVYPSQRDASLQAAAMTKQIKLSRLTARILTTVYSPGDDGGAFIENTQFILHALADLSTELNDLLASRFRDSLSQLPQMATRLILSYHHCIILTTRPLVMCVLQKYLSLSDTEKSIKMSLSPPVATLLHVCVDSAMNVIKQLQALREQDLLDSFLPFHLEDNFSSAFLCCIIDAIVPDMIPDQSWSTITHEILDTMISRGNISARLRKSELSQLQQLISPLTPSSISTSTATISGPPQTPGTAPDLTNTSTTADTSDPLHGDTSWDLDAVAGDFGLSTDDILDLADQFDMDSLAMPFSSCN